MRLERRLQNFSIVHRRCKICVIQSETDESETCQLAERIPTRETERKRDRDITVRHQGARHQRSRRRAANSTCALSIRFRKRDGPLNSEMRRAVRAARNSRMLTKYLSVRVTSSLQLLRGDVTWRFRTPHLDAREGLPRRALAPNPLSPSSPHPGGQSACSPFDTREIRSIFNAGI
jgi:hypothetical protein